MPELPEVEVIKQSLDKKIKFQKINKVFRVSVKDSAGEYIRVPRLLDAETLKMDLV